MKATFFKSLILSLLIASMLRGCFAVNYVLPLNETIDGMVKAVSNSREAFIFVNPNSNIVILGWSVSKPSANYAFVLVDKNGVFKNIEDLPRAVGAQWKGTVDFILYLEQNGWKSATASALTPAIKEAVKVASVLKSIGSMTPILVLVPATLNPFDLLNKKAGPD